MHVLPACLICDGKQQIAPTEWGFVFLRRAFNWDEQTGFSLLKTREFGLLRPIAVLELFGRKTEAHHGGSIGRNSMQISLQCICLVLFDKVKIRKKPLLMTSFIIFRRREEPVQMSLDVTTGHLILVSYFFCISPKSYFLRGWMKARALKCCYNNLLVS